MVKYMTKQRKRLLEYLSQQADEQMTARQIADALTADKISISAIYRNLADLEKEGLIKRSVRENSREAYYQYIACEKCKDSLHLSCRVCGAISHLKDEDADLLLQNALNSSGFKIEKSETILYGVCEGCGK